MCLCLVTEICVVHVIGVCCVICVFVLMSVRVYCLNSCGCFDLVAGIVVPYVQFVLCVMRVHVVDCVC